MVPELLRYLSREHVQVVELKRPRPHGRAQQGQGRRHDAAMARKAAIEQIRSLIVSASDSALAARIALEALSGCYQDLDAAIGAILEEKCVSSQGTVQLMITAGDNPERLKQRVVVLLCGVAARPVSSGLTTLHRLNRGAGRAANSAIHIVAPGRLRTDDRTRA